MVPTKTVGLISLHLQESRVHYTLAGIKSLLKTGEGRSLAREGDSGTPGTLPWLRPCAACNTSLIIQLAKKSHTTHDPVGLWLIRWQAHVYHKVSGVACGRERTSPLACFVNRGGDKMQPVNNVFLLAGFGPITGMLSCKAFPCDSPITLFSLSHREPSIIDTALGWSSVIIVAKNLEDKR